MIPPKNILIVRTDKIGDLVLTIPLAGLIKKNFPECKVTFLIASYTAPIIKNHPDIDEYIVYQNNKDVLRRIKEKNFDTAILVHPIFNLAKMLFNAKIPVRISTAFRWYSFFFTDKIFEHRKYGTKHELEHNVELLTPLGIKENINRENVLFNIQPGSKAIQQVANTLKSHNFSPALKTVIIHPGSRGSAIDLPEHKFKELISALAQQLKYNIILTGSNSEIELCERLAVGNNVINLSGKFSLEELIALISISDLFVANSTGPLHIAAALGKHVVGFYPPVPALSATRWGPYTNKKALFIPEMPCGDKCTKDECLKLNCMNSIEIENILQSITEMLK
jgi:heptosyltransferase-3